MLKNIEIISSLALRFNFETQILTIQKKTVYNIHL